MRMKDRTVLITGGAGGIGQAAALRFLEEGANVAISDFDGERGEEAVRQWREYGDQVYFVQADVSIEKSVQDMVQDVESIYGSIDVLINNAGITDDAMLNKLTLEAWERVLSVNLTGVMLCTRAVVPKMIEKGAGKIINTSSVSGVYGNIGQTNYAATKAGVIGLTKTWAKELGRKGINVNAVSPGFTLTPMVEKIPAKIRERMVETIPLGKLGRPRDIANAYLFLASEESDYVHGHILQVDGGIIM